MHFTRQIFLVLLFAAAALGILKGCEKVKWFMLTDRCHDFGGRVVGDYCEYEKGFVKLDCGNYAECHDYKTSIGEIK